MPNLSRSESRRMYSWWWDSHNTPKNSKWLQDNLTDIDGKVKSMIKLIEEDADSFARRAEMYYRKRPELMKLVEDFYRAYRALAERYNHATGELRHAQQTIEKAFPDELPFELVHDISPSQERDGPHTPEIELPMHALFRLSSSEGSPRKKGLKQLPEMFECGTMEARNQNHEEKVLDEIERAKKAEFEVQSLKKALADMKAEKENVVVQYKQCLEKQSEIEGELNNAQEDSTRLGEKASRAEIEVQTLKEALVQFEVEKIAWVIKQNDCLEKISYLEAVASRFQEDMKGLDSRASQAESDVRNLKNEISTLELEKETVIRQYKQCLGKMTDLEKIISINEDEARSLKEQAETAENEVVGLKRAFDDLNKEKEDMDLVYKCRLEKLPELEKDLSIAKNDVERRNNEVLTGNAKLSTALEKCALMETSNRSLHDQADNLAKKIAVKDQELMKTRVELNNVVRRLEEMEMSKNSLEEEIHHVRDENRSLSRTSLSSSVSMENMRNEIVSLREIRERLENEASHHVSVTVSLQKEISCLKEDIGGLNKSYHALVETSIKSLHDENSELRRKCEHEKIEKARLSKKLEEIEEVLKKRVIFESSLSDLNAELAISRGEKAALVAEKASILDQLQATTENTRSLLRKNAVLEDSLSTAKVELQGLREKSKGLEEICELLKNERSYLLSERGTLVSKLQNMDKRLNRLKKQFMGLEEKCADLEKEKEAMHCQVEKLEFSLCEEKRERNGSRIESETRIAGLENQIHVFQEEELHKSLKAQSELSILQKFIKDMEEKNFSLIVECQKHVESSKLTGKLISELEGERLEQQVEAELLLDEIERLRLGICRIFGVLDSGLDCGRDDGKVENEQIFVHHILGSIEDLKCCVSKHEDEKQQLLVENLVLLALLEQLESKGIEIESQKVHLEQESKIMAEKLVFAENEKDELLEINMQLKSDVNKGRQEAAAFQAELQKAYNVFQEAYYRVNEENTYLSKRNSELKEEKFEVDRQNDGILREFLAASNESAVLRSFGREKVTELKLLLEDLSRQGDVSTSLEKQTSALREKLDLQKAENLVLQDSVRRLEREIQEIREYNAKMNSEIINGKESLNQTEAKLEAAEKSNSNLFRTIDELKTDFHNSLRARENLEKNIFELSENNSTQKKEIESLHVVNKNLESEIGLLRQEREENTLRERTLSTELQEVNGEFELWEAEASTFCFDLQVSTVHEVLLKNKVQELCGVCQSLEHKHEAKMSEMERMQGKFCLMENEVSGLKSQLHAYGPVIASLRDDISILENNALLRTRHKAAYRQETELFEVAARPRRDSSQICPEDQSLLSLQNLQMRVKAIGKLIEESNNPVRSNPDSIQELPTVEIDQSNRKNGYAKSSNVRNGALVKDIPLDRVSNSSSRRGTQKKCNVGSDELMLELWETAEDGKMSCKLTGRKNNIVYDRYEHVKGKSLLPLTDSDVERELAVDKLELSTRKILEKLASDAGKLEILGTDLRNLKRTVETNKKSRKGKNVDFQTVEEEIQKAEDSIVHLVDLNGQLVKNIEHCPEDETEEAVRKWRIKVMEETQKGSERIERLQVGIQKIHYSLLKMEDGGKKNNKGKSKYLRSKTISLRDFIDNGRKNGGRPKKDPRCLCFIQSSSGNANGS